MITTSDTATEPVGGEVEQPEVVIETRNLSKVYRDFWGRPKVRALKALDMEVRRGEIFGLLGPNGSGKSTTIKLLLGLLFPTSGHAYTFGVDATDVAKNSRIGYLPEESYLYKFLNAEETLDFYGRLFDMPAKARQDRIDELIEMVDLEWAKRRQLKEYSKGMTRRIGLAQALINDPELILLDEPTTGLDPIGTRDMKDLIIKLREQGKTVLMCSHLLADVQDVCDRIAILHQGELKELGRVDSLLSVQDVTQVQASGLSEEAETEIRQVIEKHQGTLISMDHPTSTLEDLFLDIVRDSAARPGKRVHKEEADAVAADQSAKDADTGTSANEIDRLNEYVSATAANNQETGETCRKLAADPDAIGELRAKLKESGYLDSPFQASGWDCAPLITNSRSLREHPIGEFRAELMTEIKALGIIQYRHLLCIFDSAGALAGVVAAEFSLSRPEAGPNLCLLSGSGRSNHGENPSCNDLETFAVQAEQLVRSKLNISVE